MRIQNLIDFLLSFHRVETRKGVAYGEYLKLGSLALYSNVTLRQLFIEQRLDLICIYCHEFYLSSCVVSEALSPLTASCR